MPDSLNIVFPEPNRVELRREPVPSSLGPGEILVRTKRSLISAGTETTALQRNFQPDAYQATYAKFPMRPGYSNAGVVVAVADDVKDFQPGDRIASRSKHGQYAIATADRSVRIPDEVSDDEATWFGLGCIVQIGIRRSKQEPGDVVAVVGLGQIGQLIVQHARLLGAGEVIAIGSSRKRLELAKSHGATIALESRVEDARDDVLRLTGGRGADVVYEATANANALAPSLRLVRRLGKLILIGTTGYPSQQNLSGDFVSRGISIITAHNSNAPSVETDHDWWTHRHMGELFFTYVLRKQLRVDDLITHRFAPTDAPRAYRMLLGDERNDTMGVMFEWE